MPKGQYFRLRGLTAARTVSYIMLGLWIQMLAGYAGEWVTKFLRAAGVPVYAPDISLDGSLSKTALLVLYVCILAPVTEELLLRGFALKNLSRVSQRFGILMTALLFALMHENLPQFLFTFPLGILLAYITVRHDSVTPAIITHICVNSAAMLLEAGRLYLPGRTFRKADMICKLFVLLLGTVSLSADRTDARSHAASERTHQASRRDRPAFLGAHRRTYRHGVVCSLYHVKQHRQPQLKG